VEKEAWKWEGRANNIGKWRRRVEKIREKKGEEISS
jgi:ribosomal protein S30